MPGRTQQLIMLHEGFRARPYLCSAGATTIGYGRNLETNGISEPEAEMLLRNDLYLARAHVACNFPGFQGLSEVRQAVLVDMCFNLGLSGLMRFKRMLRNIRREDWSGAADELLDSKYARQVGQRAERLAKMMWSNEWPPEVDG